MATASPDQSRVIHIVYDETRHDSGTLEIVSQLDREVTRLELKCTYFAKDAPAGAQEIGQKEQYLLDANWIIIIYSEPTEHSSDMFIFEENMVMSEAVNRGELCVLFLIQPFMLNFNSRGFPSVVIRGTDWLDEIVKQVDQSPAQLTSTHFDDIEAYRKLYTELQTAQNFTASDPLLYQRSRHEQTARYGFPLSQIQTLYVNFLSLISWPSTQAETSTSTLLSTRQNPDSETSAGDGNSNPVESSTVSVSTESQTEDAEFDDVIKCLPVLSVRSFWFIVAAVFVWFISLVIHDVWFEEKTFHGLVLVITGNGINFILLRASVRRVKRNFFFKLMVYSCATSVVHSIAWCVYLVHVKQNGYDYACINSLSSLFHFTMLFSIINITFNALKEAFMRFTFVQLYIYFSFCAQFYSFLVLEGISAVFPSTPHVQQHPGVGPPQKPDLNRCFCTTPYFFLQAAERLAEFGYFVFHIRCGRSFLKVAINMCFKKKLACVAKLWGIEIVLYYFIRIRNSSCAFDMMVNMFKSIRPS